MANKNIFILFIRFIILISNINEYLSSFIPVGLNQLNNFIYLDRMKVLTFQNYTEKCSLILGPNCYYIEDKKSQNYKPEDFEINDNSPLSEDFQDHKIKWMNIYNKVKESSLFNIYNELKRNISEYKIKLISKNDSQQIPPSIELILSLTFESYDDITIRNDIYAYPLKSIRFFTENINLEIIGKLRLHYGEDLKLKNEMSYPSKTFGIIESPDLNIRLAGKKFICEYFFLKLRDDNIYKINIQGYLENNKVFSMQKEMRHMNNLIWTKISLPRQQIDTLLLPGGIDVDNFRFIIETKKQYDIDVQFHASKKERIKILVEDNDIY